MPAMFVFLLKVNIALLLFCAGYYAVLRHLTFYTLNRIYLVAAILFATVYPEINLDSFAQRHQQLTQPVQLVLNLETPAQTLVAPLAHPNYWYWAEVVFWIGAALLAFRLLMQLYSLYKLYRGSSPATIHGHNVRSMTGDSAPFSFWKSIYVNPDNHHPADLRSILLHEQVHVNQWHTLDILLAEISTIFYWFNPGIWLIKKAVRENIEFITDAKILNKGIDSKAYQYSLVNVSFAAGPQNIVNHFNLSTIKKRIIMMNAKRSSRFNLTRYAFLMPLVIVLLLVFSISKAAFVSKSSKVINSIAATINAVNILHDDVLTTQPSKPFVILKTKKVKLHTPVDTSVTLTGRLNNLIDTSKHKKLTYVVDGKVVENFDLNKIEPSDIAMINVNPEGKIYIITKKGPLANTIKLVKVNGDTYSIRPDGVQIIKSDIVGIDSSGKLNGHIVYDTIRARRSDILLNQLTAATRNYASGEVVVNGYKNVTVNGYGNVAASGQPITAVRINGVNMAMPSGATVNNVSVSGYRSARTNDMGTLTGKLVVIDGKTATQKEVKKLSVFDIDRMTIKTDEETKSLYGDSAKNGVIFIITKKKK